MKKWLMYPILTLTIVTMMMIPYEAADPEAADPEDSVDITGVDEQESEHAGVVTREPKLEGVGGESEE